LKRLLLISLMLLSAGCVRVNLFPEDAVKNSIRASKDIYDESKLKKSGAVKKQYTKQVVVSDYSDRNTAEIACIADLKNKIAGESIHKEPVVISEKIALITEGASQLVECQISGYIWTKPSK
jgi:hypothetical protein